MGPAYSLTPLDKPRFDLFLYRCGINVICAEVEDQRFKFRGIDFLW
jgi:hypothetical protein